MILNDLQKAKIEAFCKDEEMYNAVKSVLLQGIYSHGVVEANKETDVNLEHDPLKNGALTLVAQAANYPISDEMLGAQLRGQFAGLNALENALDELQSIRVDQPENETEDVNPAE